jgi:polyphosphate kinase
MLPAQQPDVTDNIHVVSVVGRLLEHSRVFYFRCGVKESLYLSSADWMNRNMLRRIELAWPVTDPELRRRIVEECLTTYLADRTDAWILGADDQYQCTRSHRKSGHSAQAKLMRLYAAKP